MFRGQETGVPFFTAGSVTFFRGIKLKLGKKEKVAKNESAWNRVKTASALMERASAQRDLAASTVQKKHARIIAQNMARKYLIKIWPLPALHYQNWIFIWRISNNF